ncbi:hypothetical protein [Streptomyces sp. NPDC048442]|uniref:hypothetical protein n=1 Tax=Streptomyces sp. NPDC048442 TaxID=3154823 RepID=UPI003421433D
MERPISLDRLAQDRDRLLPAPHFPQLQPQLRHRRGEFLLPLAGAPGRDAAGHVNGVTHPVERFVVLSELGELVAEVGQRLAQRAEMRSGVLPRESLVQSDALLSQLARFTPAPQQAYDTGALIQRQGKARQPGACVLNGKAAAHLHRFRQDLGQLAVQCGYFHE